VNKWKRGLLRFTVVFLLMAACVGCYGRYPYGTRDGYLPRTLYALRDYARDHDGWFPRDGSDGPRSLQRLYPGYLTDPTLLAGISGEREGVVHRLRSGGSLGEDVCSWVYWPGFRLDDDPGVAVLWERQAGVRFNGRSSNVGGHAVGFLDGRHRQVAEADWPRFVEEQEALRTSILAARSTPSTAQP
jgi:hypothetical protein